MNFWKMDLQQKKKTCDGNPSLPPVLEIYNTKKEKEKAKNNIVFRIEIRLDTVGGRGVGKGVGGLGFEHHSPWGYGPSYRRPFQIALSFARGLM